MLHNLDFKYRSILKILDNGLNFDLTFIVYCIQNKMIKDLKMFFAAKIEIFAPARDGAKLELGFGFRVYNFQISNVFE